MLKAALIGFGGITTSHRRGYYNLEKEGKVKLVAAYDINPNAFKTRVAINLGDTSDPVGESINFYTDLDEMLAKEEIDFVDICIPTYKHRELSEKLLRRGYHVLCEKPMALTSADCAEMIRASKESGKELMIGQCLRFFPAYEYMKEVVDSGRFGKVLGGLFMRLSPPPVWGWENWFMNPERSGGCITDLHIHDVDMIRYLFGEPEAVSCRATTSICVHDTVHTSLYYGGVPITAIGDWALHGVKFSASCHINFEKANITYNDSGLTIYPKDGGAPYVVELSRVSGYEGEISYFCDVIQGKIKNEKNSPESAAKTISLIEHMRASAGDNGKALNFEG